MKSEVLSVKEKIGYGMGDAASHIIFDNVMLYMMFFYTDIFGIPAGFVGTMFLVARALDAISDPCMGLLADVPNGSGFEGALYHDAYAWNPSNYAEAY